MPIDAALRDPNLLGAALGDIASWEIWLTALRAAAGLPLSEQQRETFAVIAGGRPPPITPVRELWCVIGRRSGKSRVAAALAVHVAVLQEHRLAPGEVGYVLVLSPSVAQAKTVFQYCLAFIEQSPVLQQEIASTTASEIRLQSGIIIATHSNSFRSVRGRTLLAAVFDEVSFWRDESSANPDLETYRAILPALATVKGPLIAISTPYRKLGLLYSKHKEHYGIDNPAVLVVQGDSSTFNPTLDAGLVAQASHDDPEAATAEWAGQFRADIASFLSDADIDACVDYDRPLELPPRSGITYAAFADPSGGRHDAFCLAVGHREHERTVVDVLRGWLPPFDPKLVVTEAAALLKEFGLRDVTGDNYAAAWVSTEFKAAGVRYARAELPKGRLYVEGLPAFARRTVALPDHPRLLRELRLLERRTHIGGKDTVDHGRAGSDDFANAVFGLLSVCGLKRKGLRIGTFGYGGPVVELDASTGRPLGHEPTRIRWIRVDEAAVSTAKGP